MCPIIPLPLRNYTICKISVGFTFVVNFVPMLLKKQTIVILSHIICCRLQWYCYSCKNRYGRWKVELYIILYIILYMQYTHLYMCYVHTYLSSGMNIARRVSASPVRSRPWRTFTQRALRSGFRTICSLRVRGSYRLTWMSGCLVFQPCRGTGVFWCRCHCSTFDLFERFHLSQSRFNVVSIIFFVVVSVLFLLIIIGTQ